MAKILFLILVVLFVAFVHKMIEIDKKTMKAEKDFPDD